MKKHQILKRVMASFMVVIMTLTAVPMSGFVGLELPKWSEWFATKASALSDGCFTYTVSNGEATITGHTSSISGDLVIPNTLGGYPVTNIGANAFNNCRDLTSIMIPDSVTRIGWRAFYDCIVLTSITIPDSVMSISEAAFYNTAWYKAQPYGDVYAGKVYYEYKGTMSENTNAVIKNGTKGIAGSAFYGCTGLTSITIPDSVTIIESSAFSRCTGLTSITIPDSVTIIESSAFSRCTGLTSITIPDSVTSIGYDAFDNTAWYNAQPDGDVYAGKVYYKYKGTMPENISVVIKNGTKEISGSAFEDCSGLTSITIPSSVISIGDDAFYDCTGLTNVNILDLAAWCKISFDNYLSNPLYYAKKLYVNDNLATSIAIPIGVTSIGNYAFENCTCLTSVTIPNSVTSIGDYTFCGCTGLTDITIPNVVINIGDYTFCGCTGLTDITIPNGVTNIGDYAFSGCTSLKSITIPDGVTSIGDYAFQYCIGLTNVTIGNSVTSIGDYSFYNCKALTCITIPNGVTSIGNYVFRDCTGLTSVTIPDSVTSIGKYAFRDCTGLTSVTIPDSVTSIGDSAFQYCTGLTSITIPDSVTSIGSSTFDFCTGLTSVTIGNSVIRIGYYAFMHCTGLTSITIPDSVTSIGDYAFDCCSGLTSVTIGNSVTSIGYFAFDSSSNLKDVYYTGSESDWKQISIRSYNSPLINATIHYNYVIIGPSGTSKNTSSDSSSNQPLLYDSLVITPYPQNGKSLISSVLKNATVTWGSKSATSTEKEANVCIPKSEINGPIRITEENHRDYIIPTKVASAFGKLKSAVSFPVYMTRKNTKSKYISSVIGKKDKEDASGFVDLKHSSLECVEGETATIYVTSCGLTNPTYYIAQDNYKKIPSDTGEFSAVDVYNKFGFNGDIVVYAVDSDGSKTEAVKINLSKKIRLSNSVQALEEMTTMNLLGSSAMGFSINDDFPILGGTSIDFSAFKIPVGIDINGTDVKLSFGFDFFEDKKNYETGEWEKKWKGFKANCKSTEQILNDLDDTYENWQKKWNSLENLKKQYSGKKIIKTGAPDKDKGWTCSFLGYIEGKLTEDGKICFKEGSIMASAEFQFKHSQQTAVWAIPAYYYFELGANVLLDGKVYQLVPDRSCPVDWAVTLGVEPKVAVGGGAGIVDFASVGLRGEGSAPIKLEFAKGHLTIDLKGAIYAEGQLLFIKGKKKIIDGTMSVLDRNLWGTKRAKQILSLRQEAAAYNDYDSETVVTVMDRDYAQNTSSWLGSSSGVRRAPAKAAASGGIRFTNLQTSVYNQSQPQVVTVGDKQIMVYVADDSTRDDYNRLCLMYSVNENGTWSTPKAVYSDGNNDVSPSLATDGEKVYVSWQKVAKKLTAADCESEQAMLRNMEIYLAEFNAETGSFENAKRLTNNSVYDYLPFTVVENEKASVYFAEGDPAGYTNKIVRFSGGSTATLKSSLPYVSALSAVSDEVSYSIDTDVTNGLTNDMTVYTVKDGHVSAFEKYVSEEADTTENAYNLLTYGEMDGKQTLFVSDGSSVYYQKNGKTQKAFSAVSSISGYLQAVKTDSGLTLLWLGYTDDSTEIFSCSYENGAWSEPVQVSSQGNIVSFLSANYAGGTIRGVCNITENQFNESAGDYDIGQTNLTSFVIGDFTDLSVSAFAPDETELKPGAETVINCYVTQKGTQDISALDITVTDTIGTNVNYQQDVELKSGSTINLEIPYTVPQDYKGTTITVQVNTDNADKDESDNTVALKTGKNTILLNDRPIEEFDDVYILPLSVENYTALDIENLTLTYSIENYDENTENESVTLKLDSLTEDSYNDVRIAVKKDGLVYDEDGFARINIAVYDGEDELSSLVSVIENPDQECRHAVTEETAEVPATCLEKGRAAGVKCSVCEEYISGGEEIPALGHDEVIDKAVAATCTKTGLTEGKHCARCKAVLVARKTVAKKAHTYKTTVTPATTAKDGKAVAACTVCKTVAKTVVIPKVASISLSSASYTYDGKVKTPTVTVKNNTGTALKNGTDYIVTYASGRKTPGQYAVKITFKGNYSGSKTLYFTILPGVTSNIATATNSSAIKLAWKAVPGATGYRVFQYDAKTKKYVTLKTTTGTSCTVTKLKSGTSYKFAVRAYTIVNGKVYWASGYKTVTATTNPGTPTLKVTAGTKKATLSWTKQTGATGYVVYMATSKNGKYSKIATLKGNSSVTYTKTGLTKGKTYYFKIAAYTVANGKTLYSSFSSVKAVKVK